MVKVRINGKEYGLTFRRLPSDAKDFGTDEVKDSLVTSIRIHYCPVKAD